jgi:nucleotide-binding universal stress UspA family protein
MSRSTLLVPVDFSDCAPGVVDYAVKLARDLEARVVLLNVVELPAGLDPGAPIHPETGEDIAVAEYAAREAARNLDTYVLAAASLMPGVEIVGEVGRGTPVDSILEAADQYDARLIIMGTHGRRGLARVVMGSVAEHVLRRSERPVLTLRTQHRETCAARSCAWCTTHVTPAQSRVRAELDG